MYDAIIYLALMLGVIMFWFMLIKRPIYESIFVSLLVMLTVTNKWGNVWSYIESGINSSLIYSMTVFVAMSILMTRTKIIDSAIAIILVLFGRVTGGAGYVSVIASAFMGALSGSGPGNVMATGTITIPAMKRSGFPAELAANIESTASCLGNMIPPSANIVAAIGAYMALYPQADLTMGKFWIVCWGCSIWFILQRIVTVFAFCKYYKVKPMAKEDVPNLRDALRNGWQGLMLPVIILLPFVLDFLWKDTFFTARLGAEGAKYLSSSMLYFIAGVASIYAVIVVKIKKKIQFSEIANMFGNAIKSISPTISTCIFGYMIGSLFADLNVAESFQTVITMLNMNKFSLCILLPLIACFMGMIMPGSSLIVLFGSVFISLFETVGVNPILVAAMLPCICGVMAGITPPLAHGMYAGMTIAESDFSKTVKNDLWWCILQYILEVVILMGWLPIIGL